MLEKFMEWLNSEIEGLKSNSRDNVYLSGKLAEAIRIRQAVCDMDFKNPGVDREIIKKVAGEICDHYCVFPQAYDTGRDDDNQRMIEERCDKCPLNRLMR